MPVLGTLLDSGLTSLASGYTLTLALTALTAIAAPTPDRRRDARLVLSILLHRKN
ncbi:hypothetical protein ACFC1R_38235 [Kitasatospora sp. NPDC056138]|uniref:hypothetical protein n=1 Tax=Kitasatospora sp. NPDC056138 TaxID=3345724 RepID=UPI0035DE62BD